MKDETSTILVVDDEPANVQLIEKVLAHGGYTSVYTTTDPTQTVKLYQELDPDLIMLDLYMPSLDGFEVMAQLAKVAALDDYLPILVLSADATQTVKQKALVSGAKDFVTKPFDAAEMLARIGNLLDSRALHQQLRHKNEELESKVAEQITSLSQTLDRLHGAEQDLRLAQDETIHSLALAAEMRDEETSRHIQRMSGYCAILASAMGFDERRCETLRIASKMHDVGKICLPDTIRLKPGRLTADEFKTMKSHARMGYDMLSSSTSELATTAATIAWTHHEKVDGTGYPRGLTGDEIPVEGRIAAVADVFDALTTDRIYRDAFPLPEALRIMRDARGGRFDGAILDLFFERVDDILEIQTEVDGRASQLAQFQTS